MIDNNVNSNYNLILTSHIWNMDIPKLYILIYAPN